ncbi:MAG TPA: glycosyltransferase family 4 protein, partial [Candidatus Paceibacterota bacterium]|nr:glycosyltransferase family 4 protein [Candidatus Paceibacterota bacterium]
MKILYLCPDPGIPVLGRKGASVHVRELIGAFARGGHRITLAAQTLTKSLRDEPAKVRARVIHVPPDATATSAVHDLKDFNALVCPDNSMAGDLRRVLYNSALYRDLKRRFLRHHPDFIYERASLYATAGAKLAAKFKVPHIIELNAPLALEQSAYRATGFGKLAADAERWTLSRADAVIVVSAELRKHVLSLGVKADRIHIMPNGVNTELFQPRHSTNGKNGSHPTLGFVGGLRPWHGVEVLPRLLERLVQRHSDLRLMIVGDGQLRDELHQEFKKRGLAPRVQFTGALLHEEIPAMIRRFDIALAPYSRHNHDFYFSPLKLFEYMACGVAVVASDVGQISEVVAN